MSAFLFIFNYLCIGVCIFIRWFWGGDLQNEFRESLITTQLIPHLKKKKNPYQKIKPQQKITSVVENVEKLRNLVCCSWDCGRVQPLRKTVWRFLKKSDIKLPYDQTSLASQRLRLCASTAGESWVPSLVGEVPDTAWHSQKKKKICYHMTQQSYFWVDTQWIERRVTKSERAKVSAPPFSD